MKSVFNDETGNLYVRSSAQNTIVIPLCSRALTYGSFFVTAVVIGVRPFKDFLFLGFPKGFGFRKTLVKRSGGEAAAYFICNAKRCRIVKRNGINENNRFIYGNGLLLGR